MAPSKRASFGMVTHRDRALLFGGVTDRAGAGDKMYSELHNELYQLDLTSERWRPVAMKLAKAPKVCQMCNAFSWAGKCLSTRTVHTARQLFLPSWHSHRVSYHANCWVDCSGCVCHHREDMQQAKTQSDEIPRTCLMRQADESGMLCAAPL